MHNRNSISLHLSAESATHSCISETHKLCYEKNDYDRKPGLCVGAWETDSTVRSVNHLRVVAKIEKDTLEIKVILEVTNID